MAVIMDGSGKWDGWLDGWMDVMQGVDLMEFKCMRHREYLHTYK